MDAIEIMLRALDSGSLQRLACDMLPLLHTNWKGINKSGGVEGTNKTRKGTPDAWCEREDGTLVYIQATGDPKKGKIIDDLNKSLNQLKSLDKNVGALCIAFLNFDPQNVEIEMCKVKAKEYECEFKFYSNSKISKLLQDNFPEIVKKYLPVHSSEVKKVFEEICSVLSTLKGNYQALYKYFSGYTSKQVFMRPEMEESNNAMINFLNQMNQTFSNLTSIKDKNYSLLSDDDVLKEIEKIINNKIPFNGDVSDISDVYEIITDETIHNKRIKEFDILLKKLIKLK
ncbi:hypothetical protein [Paenibacillus sp. DMB5]|uniref:hypothetical protein n=1 Tax=Paenibacillus sp. DMB5 TaxID=1780103 RepID=UPI00076DE815|nr:hypothetical protein [Paenibacillus sp. DMB5]KUP22528.1 hypothetical protein AWJ19_31590 [Paenibacillus sp. DMB5]